MDKSIENLNSTIMEQERKLKSLQTECASKSEEKETLETRMEKLQREHQEMSQSVKDFEA